VSTTFTPAETLRRHRPLLLTMEAIGWFHMAGKARAEFLRNQGGDKVGYYYEKWHRQENPPFPWEDLLGWVKHLCGSRIPKEAWPGSFEAFTEKHRDKNPGLLCLLRSGHGIVSGVEKNLPSSTSGYLGQTLLHMWLSSPWGYPKQNLLSDPPEILTPQGWQQLVGEIRRVLEEARNLGTQNVQDVGPWNHWREKAIGEGSFVRRAFLSTLAETRLPNNDVTLRDQSYVAAALFKSALAWALLNEHHPWKDTQIKDKVRWRLLTVAIGAEHYEARSVKIGDWTGARGTIQEFFDRVAELVEVDLAIGSLLYRDDSVAVFSFPGERFDEEGQQATPGGDPDFRYDRNRFAPWLEGWSEWLSERVDCIAQDLYLETPPIVRLSQPTRSLVPITHEREEALNVVAVPVHKLWDVRWTMSSDARGHVCAVCQVRLNGDPSSKTKPCETCRGRRHHRRDDWLHGELGYDTIWFEEVADGNDRLGLLTFSLDLEPWLNGDRVDSLRAQAIPEWTRFNPVLSEHWQRDESKRRAPNPIRPNDTEDTLNETVRQRFYTASGTLHFNCGDLLLGNLQEGYRRHCDWQSFFSAIVEDRAKSPKWDSLNDAQRAAWLAHQLFVKLASPGRVYRFWREAEEFFQDLLREFRQIASRSPNPWRVRRVVLMPKDKNGWHDLTLYDGRWQGQQLSLIYVQSLGGFVTASNLGRLLQPEKSQEVFQDEVIRLVEEDRFDRPRDMQVKAVWELRKPHSNLGVYAPIIPVEISPLRFRVVVPLEVASECMDHAVARWKERFARVWDRMPLRAGVVAFPRKLPFQAVVEATRNLEDALKDTEEIWQIEEGELHAGVMSLHLTRKDGQSTLQALSTIMPDGREDVFYPYFVVEDQWLRFPRDFRHPGDGRIYRHVTDLRRGDGIRVHPARVATLFMDSTAARFTEVDVRYLKEWERMRETWELLRRVAPTQTALQRLRSELARIEDAWRTPDGSPGASEDLLHDTYRGVLAHHLECQGMALETLTRAATKGWLHWSMDWHITVLKEGL